MASLDRFLVGIFVGAAGIAYYSTPQDMILKVLFIPISLSTVLLPKLSVARDQQDTAAQTHNGLLLFNTLTLSLLVVGLISGTIALLANELLSLWLGEEFSRNSALPLQIMALGVVVNTVGIIIQSVIYSAGHSREVALLQIIELPLYFVGQCFAVYLFGLPGAACAWTIRIIVDTVMLWRIARVKSCVPLPNWKNIISGLLAYLTICFFALGLGGSLFCRLTILFVLAILVGCFAFWTLWSGKMKLTKVTVCLV
jgi:O-antigen/teichoic acid export membrane protein